MTAAAAEQDVARERLHWSFELDGTAHVLELYPSVGRRTVALELDGRPAGRMAKPTRRRPWETATLSSGGRAIVVALTWNVPVMRTDLFVDGLSQRDGVRIEDARADAPRPMGAYEDCIGGVFRYQVPSRRPFLRPWMAIVAVVCVVVLVVFVRIVPPPTGVAAGTVAAVPLVTLCVLWFRTWLVVAERTHVALLARPKHGETGRLVVFWVVFVGYGLGGVVGLIALVALLSFIR
jgi:hypothetical protein